MEQLIFFAVIIFFSIIESIARSRKQRQGGQLPPAPGEAPPEWEAEWKPEQPRQRPMRPPPGRSDVPSYDDDASFDARTSEEGRTSEAGRSFDETASSEEERRKRAASSESMIPADIWEEIAGLAAKVELPVPPPRPK